MPLLSELIDTFDPEADEERDPEAFGEHIRVPLGVDEDVGRRVIQKIQPELEYSGAAGALGRVGGFFQNLGENVGEFATGMFNAATFPLVHPQRTVEALEDPVGTAKFLGNAIAEGYKEAYTPKPDETIPGMLLRRLYEKPFDTLMDASALAQVASGGLGLAARGATAGVRAAAEGGRAAEALALAGGAAKLAPADVATMRTMREAASANRAIDLFDALGERAAQVDPLTIAGKLGVTLGDMAVPDLMAAVRTNRRLTDELAERNALLHQAEAEAEVKVQGAFGELNDAEKLVIHPYIAGRLNFDRPVGEQLMTHTGEWVPVKGDVIRPDALEKARQAYIPIQEELERLRGLHPDQVTVTMGQKALGDAEEFLGEHFDPFHPEVQQYVTDTVQQALIENADYRKLRATGEMRTSLDIAKERAYRTKLDDAVKEGKFRTIAAAERGIPVPAQTTVEEALAAMGPQGGIYFPHSSEAFTRDQSTIKGILSKAGQASTFKENNFALYREGVLEHQDPVKALLRTYATFNKGRTWMTMARDAAEDAVKEGTAFRMNHKWDPNTDIDVIKGTHQPFHPGRVLTEDLIEEDAQRMLVRLMEVAEDAPRAPASEMTLDAVSAPRRLYGAGPNAPTGLPGGTPVGDLNYADIVAKMISQSEKGPMFKLRKEIPVYKVPSAMGHAFKALRESMEPATNPAVRLLDTVTAGWNWANLNVRMSRMVNNVVGNTMFAAMQGVHPFAPRGLTSLIAAGKAIGAKAGLLQGAEARQLAKVFDLPGVRSGGLQLGLEQAVGTFGDTVQRAGEGLGRVGQAVTAPVRGLGHWASFMQKANGHVESAYRAASLFYELSPNAIERAQRMSGHMAKGMDLAEKIDAFAKAGGEVTMKLPEYRDALRQVNRYFNNYDRTTPFERMVTRRVFPYYKFFKHSTDLITRFPFEHPLKGQVAKQLGKIAEQDIKDTVNQWGFDWAKEVQPYLKDGIPLARTTNPETGENVLWMYSTKGANPFSQTSGYASEQMLQLLNPVVKIAIEHATGVNLFTRQRYRGVLSSFTGREVDKDTGEIVDSFQYPSMGESFLRSFWPYQAVRDFVAQGRVPTDTASLLAMATNAPNAWEWDPDTGFAVRKPTISRTQAAGRFVGAIPSPVEHLTEREEASRNAVVGGQLNELFQRYPEKQSAILKAIEETAEEVALEYERRGQ